MSLTREEVNGMTSREMILYIISHEELSSIDVFGVRVSSIAVKLKKFELQEILLGIPHTIDEMNPSWFDLFINIRERGIEFYNSISKSHMKKLLSNFNSLRNMRFDELLEQSPSWINLRALASRFGYVKDNCRKTNYNRQKLCEMVGLPCIEYGYQCEVILLAKYFGFTNAENLPPKLSAEFLGIQPYPKTINELADIDEERFNRDVIIVRASLKSVIHRMNRTKMVKLVLAKYNGYKYLCGVTSQELDSLLGT